VSKAKAEEKGVDKNKRINGCDGHNLLSCQSAVLSSGVRASQLLSFSASQQQQQQQQQQEQQQLLL